MELSPPLDALLRDLVDACQKGAPARTSVEDAARALDAQASAVDAPDARALRDVAAQLRLARTPLEAGVAGARAMRLLATRASARAAAHAKAETKAGGPAGSAGAGTDAGTRRARLSRDERRDLVLSKQQLAARERDARATLGPLERPVESLSGVGEALGKVLRRRGLATIEDLLYVFPRRYEDERVATPIASLVPGERQVTVGIVASARWGGRRMFEVRLEPPPSEPGGRFGQVRLVWFRGNPGLEKRFTRGARFRAAGKVEEYRGVLSMSHPDTLQLDSGAAQAPLGIAPRYPDVPGIAPRTLARAIRAAVDRGAAALPEAVPPAVLDEHGLPTLASAVRALHSAPATLSDDELAAWNEGRTPMHARLAFEEFFLLELALHQRRIAEAGIDAPALAPDGKVVARAVGALPFELTAAQRRAVGEIAADVARTRPMRRLLQGDVGSGKTAVAMLAASHAVGAGAQVALMAPTEILAEQHLRALGPLAKALGLRMALVLGGARAAHRDKTRRGLASGTIDVAIGTHALLTEGVRFQRLGLVIVDEQHRFGVAQRLALVQKGEAEGRATTPHLLVMTATPIPRSLALALYGDLDASVLDELPPGRIPSTTRVYSTAKRAQALAVVRRALDKAGKAYVVCPTIDPADPDDPPVRSATETFAELSKVFGDVGVALLHGRLAPEERQDAMARFLAGSARVLVTTTVIEVGVDVPEANVVLVEHAERFGLAQLHQLRGRVGRAGQPSACLLVHDGSGAEATERLRVLVETTDGFRVAEEDLRMRGPGELFGRRQSGLPGFRFGDLRRDLPLLGSARDAARAVLARDPELALPEHAAAAAAIARLDRDERGVVKEEAG